MSSAYIQGDFLSEDNMFKEMHPYSVYKKFNSQLYTGNWNVLYLY